MYILNDYDETLKEIVANGDDNQTRTGIICRSLTGVQCSYDISEYFPLPTKRQYAYKSIFSELLWMLSGSTNVNDLEAMGSKIWSAWKNKDFEEKNGYSDGELGPIYGFQMRHQGGDYLLRKTNPGGFDQVSYIVNELKTNKNSRRIMMDLWNAKDVCSDKVALPPCHFNFYINIDSKDRMTGILTQRSGDWLPGVSANVFFYSAFIYMLCQQTGYKPYKLIHNIHNAHIYMNQMEAVEEYLSRNESPDSPKLILNQAKDIFSYSLDDFVVAGYNPLPKIKVPVAV
jgi:thymidylate synthase